MRYPLVLALTLGLLLPAPPTFAQGAPITLAPEVTAAEAAPPPAAPGPQPGARYGPIDIAPGGISTLPRPSCVPMAASDGGGLTLLLCANPPATP